MAQTQVFRGTARTITHVPTQGTSYSYHHTAVVLVKPDGAIRLDSGGWKTATTKLAMNQASNQDDLGFRVYAKRGDWFVSWRGEELPFADGMVLMPNASVGCAAMPSASAPTSITSNAGSATTPQSGSPAGV